MIPKIGMGKEIKVNRQIMLAPSSLFWTRTTRPWTRASST